MRKRALSRYLHNVLKHLVKAYETSIPWHVFLENLITAITSTTGLLSPVVL